MIFLFSHYHITTLPHYHITTSSNCYIILRNRDGSGNPTARVGLSVGARNCNGQPGFFLLWKTLSAFRRLKGFSVGEKRLPKTTPQQIISSPPYLIVVDNSSIASIGFKAFNRNSSSIKISGNSYFIHR